MPPKYRRSSQSKFCALGVMLESPIPVNTTPSTVWAVWDTYGDRKDLIGLFSTEKRATDWIRTIGAYGEQYKVQPHPIN